MKKTFITIATVLVVMIACTAVIMALSGSSHIAADNDPEPEVSGDSNILVAYFSWSGHGKQMADWIAEETGGDLFRILTEEPYGEDFDSVADRAKSELDSGTRPTLSTRIDPEVMANYDVIYLGFPIWWYDLPTPVWTFLEEYDLSGKTIIPFFSHNGSSGGANSLNRLKELASGADVLTDDALSISGGSVSGSERQVKSWAFETYDNLDK